jgi:hypothetical protein
LLLRIVWACPRRSGGRPRAGGQLLYGAWAGIGIESPRTTGNPGARGPFSDAARR